MPTTKMRAPENFGGLTLEGRSVDVGSDGSFHADHRDIAQLAAHGFVPWPAGVAEPSTDPKTMTRAELIDFALGKTREHLNDTDTETIRRGVVTMTGGDDEDLELPTEAEMAEAKINANDVTPEKIAGMKRNELFAYLKAEGVSASVPITNDKLREIALDTLTRKQPAA